MSASLVVFDLDGTLIDTAHDLVASLNHTIGLEGLDPVGYGDLTYLVGHGGQVMIKRAFSLRGRDITDGELERMLSVFVEHYAGAMPGVSVPYPGLIEALDRLSGSGYRLAVCTNKMEGLARRLIDGLGLTTRFAAITGGDTFAVRKPDAEHLLGTVRLAEADPKRTVMVGDSLNDMLVARNAGVPSIGVPFGYSDVPVAELEPSHVVTHFDELTPDLIERLLAR
ncbi:phosphoglycolate phosphatase [Shinella curvata]|uniref:Phosphoglycolate phosphatase n=1 Tax=Shinella curvata TaxID=1817964 RepID=A0ABT8X8F6_9HYPH|nr:HAD family hydrolase [Shinella curvata]MCJ8052102.1 phosphoglycolate phosphatase [Shinella curvata]MDO6119950.1 phosphoglycolate phosphatase [Shinella curvata]